MIEEKEIQRTLLYIGDEGEVSMDVIVDQERETFWQLKRQWLKCLMFLNKMFHIILRYF